jgi:hypothetical protein
MSQPDGLVYLYHMRKENGKHVPTNHDILLLNIFVMYTFPVNYFVPCMFHPYARDHNSLIR